MVTTRAEAAQYVKNAGGLKLVVAIITVVGLSGAAFLVHDVYGPTIAIKASTRSTGTDPAQPAISIALASPGRIEGQSDSIDVGGGIDGVIRLIRVREGQRVGRGQILAELDCRALPIPELRTSETVFSITTPNPAIVFACAR